jgi:hypothetical protein
MVIMAVCMDASMASINISIVSRDRISIVRNNENFEM